MDPTTDNSSSDLVAVANTRLEEGSDSVTVELPKRVVQNTSLRDGHIVQVAVHNPPADLLPTRVGGPTGDGPPVNSGDEYTVTIDTVGDQGDGIAKVEGGFVLIIPDADPHEQVTVEVTNVYDSHAEATVTNRHNDRTHTVS